MQEIVQRTARQEESIFRIHVIFLKRLEQDYLEVTFQ